METKIQVLNLSLRKNARHGKTRNVQHYGFNCLRSCRIHSFSYCFFKVVKYVFVPLFFKVVLIPQDMFFMPFLLCLFITWVVRLSNMYISYLLYIFQTLYIHLMKYKWIYHGHWMLVGMVNIWNDLIFSPKWLTLISALCKVALKRELTSSGFVPLI